MTGYWTDSIERMPTGIHVTRSGNGIVLRDKHVHHLGNDNATRCGDDMNARGIAIYD